MHNVRQLPGAALAPVANPVLRGRPPKVVRSLTRYRAAKGASQAREHAAKADEKAQQLEASADAMHLPHNLREQIASIVFHCRVLGTMTKATQDIANALMDSECPEPD